jgi:ribosome assembly protein YihI (activator of Der GTPase)
MVVNKRQVWEGVCLVSRVTNYNRRNKGATLPSLWLHLSTPTIMPGSRKRRSSIESNSSSELSEDARETKRRKTEDSGSPSNDSDDRKSEQTTESSDSASSDIPTPLDGTSTESAAEEGKTTVTMEDSPVDSVTAELERLKKELATKDEVCLLERLYFFSIFRCVFFLPDYSKARADHICSEGYFAVCHLL